jgi:hypothetical protein
LDEEEEEEEEELVALVVVEGSEAPKVDVDAFKQGK